MIAAAALAGGCAIGANSRLEIASYDFGPAPSFGAKTLLSRPVVVYDVSAPAWMDTPAIFYRLAYRDPARPQAYANNRWVMPPAALLTSRLRQRLSGASSAGVVVPADAIRTEAALRVELDDFAQVFDAADRSRALVRVRATLVGGRIGILQRSFSVEKAVTSADAEGGVRSLAAASDEVIEQLLEWLAAQLKG
ncbi:MAG: membrane integrity-associated transporter subunit PqiC [Betaproteobacteria bacterium]|nr:membrane integrity-associated transporter subunit PqiC [Betaproteobacteria bacterium]